MVKIVADSSTLYSVKQGEEAGIIITPLNVSINGNTYREFEDIDSKAFLELIEEGHMPSSSQPAIGEKMEIYEASSEDIIDLVMADGLSGTYQSACMAKNNVENNEHIHVVNTRTLCGPHRYLVNKAAAMTKENASWESIIEAVEASMNACFSFLIPMDYSFLKRGGRLTPAAAAVGGLLKLVPVMMQTEDGTRLEKFTIKRTMKSALEEIVKYFESKGVNEDYYVCVAHANREDVAGKIQKVLSERLACDVELLELSPAFITQGGPGCVAIQAIKK